MKREIKFRVWDKSTLSFIKKYDNHGEEIGLFIITPFNNLYVYRDEKNLDFQQFTGFKEEEEGVDIYEGDILTGNFTVVFYNGAFGFWAKENSIPEFFMLYRYLGTKKVIGNIYENPELI